jgi:hypothetical protein
MMTEHASQGRQASTCGSMHHACRSGRLEKWHRRAALRGWTIALLTRSGLRRRNPCLLPVMGASRSSECSRGHIQTRAT